MSITRIWTVLVLLLLATAAPALAQDWQPFGPVDVDPDYQWFAPVDLGEYGEEPLAPEGFFFEYQRLNWNISRSPGSPVGSKTAQVRSLPPIPDILGAPTPPLVKNGIDQVVPEALFGWGNRMELGYMVDDNGWFASILTDFHVGETLVYGELGVNGGSVPQLIGNVPVNFEPSSLLLGFIDMDGDGNADDLDGDGVFGQSGADTDADGVPDTAATTDFDDQIEFPVFFEQVTVNNYTKLRSVELMKSHRFKPFHYSKSVLEFYYGARYMKMDDRFGFLGEGGFPFADTEFESQAVNNLLGPQIGARLFNRRGRWKFDAEGRFFAAYNFQNLSMDGITSDLLENVLIDAPVFQMPRTVSEHRTDKDWSPVVELRLDTSYQVTRDFAINVGYTAMYMDAIARASDYVGYTVPALSLREDQDPGWVFVNGVNFGVEYKH